jgi:putative endonuclease
VKNLEIFLRFVPQDDFKKINKQGFIYILTNEFNTVFYTGVSSNLVKRVWEHKNNAVDGFTKKYCVHKLVYYEVLDNIEIAIEREKYIKGKKREFKKKLIEKDNSSYEDLYKTIL